MAEKVLVFLFSGLFPVSDLSRMGRFGSVSFHRLNRSGHEYNRLTSRPRFMQRYNHLAGKVLRWVSGEKPSRRNNPRRFIFSSPSSPLSGQPKLDVGAFPRHRLYFHAAAMGFGHLGHDGQS